MSSTSCFNILGKCSTCVAKRRKKDSQKKIILRKWIKLNGLNSPNQKVLDNLINIFIKTSKNNSYFHWGAKGKKGSVSIKKTKECLVVSELI